jgi:hypothetical protein
MGFCLVAEQIDTKTVAVIYKVKVPYHINETQNPTNNFSSAEMTLVAMKVTNKSRTFIAFC